MADFVFPQPDVGEFEAPNGLTYTHDGQKWVVKNIPSSKPLGDEVAYLPLSGGTLGGTLEINGTLDKDGKINPLLCRADGYYMSFGVNKAGEVFAGSSPSLPFMATEGWHVVTQGSLDKSLQDYTPAWTPSAFAWEWGGNNDTREDPGTGKFQVSNDNKSTICLSATMANGLYVGNVFKSSHNYSKHKDRICLWHEQTKGQWKVWFDSLIVEYDGASNWWYMKLDPHCYGKITSWSNGLYYVTGGPFG